MQDYCAQLVHGQVLEECVIARCAWRCGRHLIQVHELYEGKRGEACVRLSHLLGQKLGKCSSLGKALNLNLPIKY